MNRQGAVAVTGSSRGIGAAIAVALARSGCTVGCLSRAGAFPQRNDLTPEVAARMIPIPCDVNDEAIIRHAFKKLAEQAGGLWALVNNAGIHMTGPSDRFTTEQYIQVMHTNAQAVFVASREAFPYLVANQGGVIINIGSFFDRLGVKRNLAYCASKAAVGAITRCLAVEWAPKGIRVVDVAPGYIQTDLNREAMAETSLRDFLANRIPGGSAGTAEEVGEIVAILATRDFGFLTGETIYLDGGQSINH